MRKLFYQTPPSQWMEGLPVGNGRLACMVWGNEEDRLTLNHEWLWAGQHRDRKAQQAAEGLPLVRKYIREGNHYMATTLANALFGGQGGVSGLPQRVDSYQPAGELCMQFAGNAVLERRELDLTTGIASVIRKCSEAEIRTEVFADCRDGCIAAHWESKEAFSGVLSLSREEDSETKLRFQADQRSLRMDGSIAGGIRFAVSVHLLTDGTVVPQEDRLAVQNATFITCTVNMATDRKDLRKELFAHLFGLEQYQTVRAEHAAKFSRLMEQVDFALEENPEDQELPTDVRIQRIKEGKTDNGILQLYFDFGRYLLISSSICGELPANLQGKWNDSLTPPWNSDYHFDINLQMNYWMAEPLGLGSCIPALVHYVRSFMESGQESARRLYGCKGIYLPLQSDAWGNATPESLGWAVWIGAAPWIARHFWDHYRYSGDLDFLRNEAYDFFKLIAEFYEDYLQKDENGVYQILPSQSPENTIAETGIFPVLIDQSSAMDVQLCYDSLGYAIRSAEILGVDRKQAAHWEEMRSNLPPFAIGSDGRLMEWQKEYPEKEPGHRHLSHLYGIYPSDLFTPQNRSAQYAAGKKSLAFRLSHGGGHTGWSRAWTACLFARIGNGAAFLEHYTALIQDFATSSLLDLHPPRIFQIDGNLGGTAAVIEAIVSYYNDTAHLLSGLPAEWKKGHMNGIHIPGGHILDIAWENRRVTSLRITFGFSGEAKIFWNGETHIVNGDPGQMVRLL